ncbi:asparaginase domain-containing protein, partial [Arthrospira platensis SPKY1]|nr:asparaginase domain-containing protein [Arthrospira platensis SPKY1]
MTLPRIALIATGGTIAGAAASATQISDYAVGGVTASQLLASVPQLASVADIEAVQPFNIDSKNMHPRQWLELAVQAQTMLARPD